MTDTPKPPADPAPEGFRWVEYVDTEWRVDEGRCRRFVSRTPGSRATKACAEPAVAALNRMRHNPHTGKRSNSWWRYCPEHLYGRWIKDGKVWYRRLEAMPRG